MTNLTWSIADVVMRELVVLFPQLEFNHDRCNIWVNCEIDGDVCPLGTIAVRDGEIDVICMSVRGVQSATFSLVCPDFVGQLTQFMQEVWSGPDAPDR